MARTKVLKVLLEPEEYEAIQEVARQDARTASSWARAVLVGTATREAVEMKKSDMRRAGETPYGDVVGSALLDRWSADDREVKPDPKPGKKK